MPLYTESRLFRKLPNRIEALQIFWLSFFHDIHRKITGIEIVCDIARRGDEIEEDIRSIKTLAKSTLRVMDKMYRDISLDLTTIRATLSVFSFSSCLNEVIKSFKFVNDLRDDELQLNLSTKLKDASIETDELLLNQVITHLLGNAFKLSETHTTIEVSCKNKDSQLIIEVSYAGMLPESDRDYVFTPYLCGDDLFYEIGLGLYLCRLFVEALNGLIKVRCKDGTTTFTVQLQDVIKQHVQQFPDI